MRRFQEAGRSTSSTPEGAAGCPPPSVSPKHRPDKIQKTPSADHRRQGTQRGGRGHKESRPAGDRKVTQEEEK